MSRSLRSNTSAAPIWPLIGSNQPLHQALANPAPAIQAIPQLQAINQVMAGAISWSDDPFQDRINPSTKSGQAIYLEKSKGRPDDQKLVVTKSNSDNIMQHFLSMEASMGKGVTAVPINRNVDGTSSGQTANILSQYSLITIDDLQRQAHTTYMARLAEVDPIPGKTVRPLDPANVPADKATFYDRVDSNIVARGVKNSITTEAYESLLIEKEKFAFVDAATGLIKYDGPTLLWILIHKIEPDNVLGLEMWRRNLASAKLHEHGNDVGRLLNAMQTLYRKIKNNGKTHDSYRDNISSALTSGPNSAFNDWMQRIIDDYESGTGANAGITVDNLISAARQKHAMMVDKKSWGQVDPKNAQILALSTRLDQVTKELSLKQKSTPAPPSGYPPKSGAPAGNATLPTPDMKDKTDGPEKWRSMKKGEEMEMYGHPWYWCPHHKHPQGKFDGLYCRHKPCDHGSWKKTMQDKKKQQNGASGGASVNATDASVDSANDGARLTLTDSVKNVLLTNFGISEADATKILDEATSQANF